MFQTGVPARPAASDYPAHDAQAGAASVPASQVAKVFSASVAKGYLVIEFALYPNPGESFDLDRLDFALNWGQDARLYPAGAEQAAWWGHKAPDPASVSSGTGVHLVGEAGISVGSRTDPATGKAEHGVGTWAGVGVDNRPLPPPAASPANPADDPYAVEGRLRRMAFPTGLCNSPVAGYLYFPIPAKRPKAGAAGLEFSRNGERKELQLQLR